MPWEFREPGESDSESNRKTREIGSVCAHHFRSIIPTAFKFCELIVFTDNRTQMRIS